MEVKELRINHGAEISSSCRSRKELQNARIAYCRPQPSLQSLAFYNESGLGALELMGMNLRESIAMIC